MGALEEKIVEERRSGQAEQMKKFSAARRAFASLKTQRY